MEAQNDRASEIRTSLAELRAMLVWDLSQELRTEWDGEYRPSSAFRLTKRVVSMHRLPHGDGLPHFSGYSFNEILNTCREVFGMEQRLLQSDLPLDAVLLIASKRADKIILEMKLAGEISNIQQVDEYLHSECFLILDPLEHFVQARAFHRREKNLPSKEIAADLADELEKIFASAK